MASLPSAHPTVSLHLTDPALTPLISSSSTLNPQSTSPRFRALTDLTTASITAYTSTERLGFGRPQRIIIDTSKNGPVILHAFLNPEQPRPKDKNGTQSPESADGTRATAAVLDQTREALRPLSSSTVEEDVGGRPPAVDGATETREGPGSSEVILSVNGEPLSNGLDKGKGVQEESTEAKQAAADEGKLAPLLIATVVALSHDHEARRAMGRLEKLGVEFQRKWVEKQAARADVEEEEESNADG